MKKTKKTVLITGASGGIGSATASKFAENGYNVILAGRNISSLRQKAAQMNECAYAFEWDVSEISEIKNKVHQAISLFGTLDVVVNNAGCLFDSDRVGDFFGTTEEEWDTVLTTNAKSVFFICQAVTAYMLEVGIKGHIVNVCSEMGFRPAMTNYAISKWAVRGMTYGLGRYFAPYGIVINGVAPGHTATKIVKYTEGSSLSETSIPRGVMAKPEEIANLIFFLGSESGNNIMGEVIISDGARHLW